MTGAEQRTVLREHINQAAARQSALTLSDGTRKNPRMSASYRKVSTLSQDHPRAKIFFVHERIDLKQL
jgi:hypothetical protein